MRACLPVNEVAETNFLQLSELLTRGLPRAERGRSVILTAGEGFPSIPAQMQGIKVQSDQVAEQSDLAFVL